MQTFIESLHFYNHSTNCYASFIRTIEKCNRANALLFFVTKTKTGYALHILFLYEMNSQIENQYIFEMINPLHHQVQHLR